MAGAARKWLRRIATVIAVLLALVLVAAGLLYWRLSRPNTRIGLSASQGDRAAEAARLRALGLTVPDGGVVLERPFDAPFTSRSYVVPQSWLAAGPKAILAAKGSVRADLLLRDLDVLQPAMERNYGGWASAERHGVDWRKLFDDWRAQLKAKGEQSLSIDDAFAPMDGIGRLRIDNHTTIPLLHMTAMSLSQSAKLASPPKGVCTVVDTEHGEVALAKDDLGEQPRRAQTVSADRTRLEEVSYIALPSRLGVLKRVKCADEWIALAGGVPRDLSLALMIKHEGEQHPFEARALAGGVVYLRLPTFAMQNYRGLDKLVPTLPPASAAEHGVIFDLRDNEGGASDLAAPIVERYVDTKRFPTRVGRATLAKSCLYPAFRWNFTSYFSYGVRELEPNEKTDFQQGLDELFAPSPEGCPRKDETETGPLTWKRGTVAHGVEGRRILVWIDGGCGSDCEYLTTQLGALPETVVVGSNSGGVSQFIQPGYGVLPNSRLSFRFALGESDMYGDGRSVDGHGLDVDVFLRADEAWTPEDLASVVLPLLR